MNKELLEILERIDWIQKYSIVTSHERKQELVSLIKRGKEIANLQSEIKDNKESA